MGDYLETALALLKEKNMEKKEMTYEELVIFLDGLKKDDKQIEESECLGTSKKDDKQIEENECLGTSKIDDKQIAVKWTDEQLKAVLEDCPHLGDNTKKHYRNCLKKIQETIWLTDLWTILMNPEEYEKKLEIYADRPGHIYEKLCAHAKESYITVLCSIMTHSTLNKDIKDVYEKWDNLYKRNRESIEKKYRSNEPTERQKKGYIEWDDLIKARDEMKKGQERLFLLMHTEIPPRRLDYWSLRVYKEEEDIDEEEMNYVKLYKDKTGDLVTREYKTSKKYGDQTFKLPEKVEREIRESLSMKPRKYLFTGKRGNKYARKDQYGSWANEVLNKIKPGLNVTLLRHIYVSRRDLLLERKSGEEQEKISRVMGHSREQQNKYSWHAWDRKISESI
jgi:hypothetical protein